jgi:hypothetical protein
MKSEAEMKLKSLIEENENWPLFITIFMPLHFNLSNWETDTLASSTILINFQTQKSIYTEQSGKMPSLMKCLIKRWLNWWPEICN